MQMQMQIKLQVSLVIGCMRTRIEIILGWLQINNYGNGLKYLFFCSFDAINNTFKHWLSREYTRPYA